MSSDDYQFGVEGAEGTSGTRWQRRRRRQQQADRFPSGGSGWQVKTGHGTVTVQPEAVAARYQQLIADGKSPETAKTAIRAEIRAAAKHR